ncbi:myristoyl CoA:protein N-myristoyltransferase [Cardiosporidium cionae]|uniref:Glycylpeptide N-tetradecanoyltransferase n=1 Tax=Cardiosporidium cionae TaxID=476202 RepID=A0ABQ7J6A8_9APIC|nr:myristoyl CoA:protein N-myristoyltransferase [Cardiosporidium cionae]|eukprot:KAF8819527.1 myristoyl CoA:protein N-myristoyltransferase [Cardiosporidium cionae]
MDEQKINSQNEEGTANCQKKSNGLRITESQVATSVHKFWDKMPVPKLSDEIESTFHGPIDIPKTVQDVKDEPYKLPSEFVWSECNIFDPVEAEEVLIKEITRRINLRNIWQAAYTAGAVLTKPVAKTRYWHRSLNPRKLVDIGFSALGKRMTMSRALKLYKVPPAPLISGIRVMREEDVPSVCKLVTTFLSKYKVALILSEEECAHWLLPRENVIYSYVREFGGKITDFISFYDLPSSILKKDNYDTLKAAYSYYNVATTVPLKDLISDALSLATSIGFDVYNALDIVDNSSFFEHLKFGIGDGFLQYYLFNWKCPMVESSDVALILM